MYLRRSIKHTPCIILHIMYSISMMHSASRFIVPYSVIYYILFHSKYLLYAPEQVCSISHHKTIFYTHIFFHFAFKVNWCKYMAFYCAEMQIYLFCIWVGHQVVYVYMLFAKEQKNANLGMSKSPSSHIPALEQTANKS